MLIVNYGLKGPFKNEAQFKAALLNLFKERKNSTYFEIEEGEKNPGFPDILGITLYRDATLIETKVSDENGTIVFQKTQPLFYKKYSGLPIRILAWDIRYNYVVEITPNEVVKAKSLRIKLPERPEE